MINTIYNCDEERLEKQKQYLREQLIHGQNNESFLAIDLECGTGKTIVAEFAFASELLKTDLNALFVRERNEECIKSAERINKIAGKTIAIAINTDTHNTKQLNQIIESLKNYRVIIITHEKYKVLSVDKQNRKYFAENRQILVIDEFLNMATEILQINKQFISSFETLLNHRTLRELFSECVKDIEFYLLSERKERNSFFNAKQEINIINKKINKLKKMVQKTLSNEYVKTIGYTKKGLCKKIDELKQFYIQSCVVEGNTMYCTDRNYQYWLLDNNIILDASARINAAYKFDPGLFKLQHQRQVLNHSKWTFEITLTNTCASAKERAIDLYEILNNEIEKQGMQSTLYIGNKNDENHIKAKYKNHYRNITGSNEYKDLKNVVSAHNPNVPFRIYVLEYLYFSKEKLDNRSNWSGKNSGAGDCKVFRFNNEKLEDYRQSKNANEIYQAIKRINRNMQHESNVIIFNNDTEMLDRVLKMFKGKPKVNKRNNVVQFEKSKKDKYNEERRENSYVGSFIKLCFEIMKSGRQDLQATMKRNGKETIITGTYKKSKLREELGIRSKSYFADKVLNSADVIDFLKKHNIDNVGQSLDFSGSHF